MALPELPRVISLFGEGDEAAWTNAIENRYGYMLIIAPLFWYFMGRWGWRLWNMDTVYECRECRAEFESVYEYEAHFRDQHKDLGSG